MSGCTSSSDATLTIVNDYADTSIDITELYIAPVGETDFTDNLLDSDLLNGDSITVEVTCDTYDVEVVDSDGFDCVATDYDLCGTDDTLYVDESFCAFRQSPKDPGAKLVPHKMPALHIKQ